MYSCAYCRSWLNGTAARPPRISKKHGIDFADAATVLEDEFALTRADHDHDEERFVTVGADALGRVPVVVYTWRDDEPRLMSARSANRRERRQYEEGE